MRLALYQPDIPQNAGAIMRLAACMDVSVDVVMPCGFPFGDRSFRRAGMDYLDRVRVARHASFDAFLRSVSEATRLVLLTTKGATAYTDFAFQPNDILLIGRESAGAPPEVHEAAAARIVIPMARETRSLNVAIAAGMVLGEALRQTARFPRLDKET